MKQWLSSKFRRGGKRREAKAAIRVGIHFAQTSVTMSVLSADHTHLLACVTRPCSRDQVGRVLGQLVDEYDVKGKAAYVTLSRKDYDTQFVDLPGVGDDELRDALRYRVTPPGVLGSEEVVTTGVRLSNERETNAEEQTLVRATVISRNLLDWIVDAVDEAKLDLQAVFPRETTLITLARQAAEAGEHSVEETTYPPTLSVFVAELSTGLAVARRDNLFLSRTVTLTVDREAGFSENQIQRLTTECVRTAENFNKRLSSTPLARAYIGPDFAGMATVRERLADALGIDCEILRIPPHIEPADDATASTAATPEGMLAVAGTLNVELPENASIYERPSRTRSVTSPELLAMGLVAGIAVLAVISGVQAWLVSGARDDVERMTTERDALQAQVSTLREEIEAVEQAEPDARYVAEQERLERRRDLYTRILNEFEGVDTSLIDGFASPLRALAENRVDGLWLQSINIEPGNVTIRGKSLSALQAETLAGRLRDTSAFRDWSPRRIGVDNFSNAGNGITFLEFTMQGPGLFAAATPVQDGNSANETGGADLQRLLRRLNNGDN
ncbi:hypothetical protein [Spiribacter vilamensis]|uniref:Uncharacterized protein n=1 Tax=Spiribacter vilamensis TaxID=531306 RepID=A0A4Q8CZX8_9GAMM|nr:hypothetical protein [Spiribacter vilamensis]RZU98601.1 hypothetical protein EV698_0855 [Spiribacter vilamensis]TVO60140.1 hypothetical protein FPL09_09920 [Spiribacter vilamensis]